MNRKILIVLTAAMLSLGANAQLLWKVTSPQSGKTSYILGTHHFAPEGFLDSIPGFTQALNRVDKFYGELDMAVLQDPDALMVMQKKMIAPADSTLDKLLSAAQMDSLRRVWSQYRPAEIPEQVLTMLTPAAVSTQLAAGMARKMLPPMDLSQGIDQMAQTRARLVGKEVGGLESLSMQANILYGAPISRQAADLVEMVENIESEGQDVVQLTNAYLKQDMPALENMILKAIKKDPEGQARLITDRNKRWAKKLMKEMHWTPTMVVVGAGHLPTPEGLLQLLRDAGYTVEPIDNTPAKKLSKKSAK